MTSVVYYEAHAMYYVIKNSVHTGFFMEEENYFRNPELIASCYELFSVSHGPSASMIALT
jgi:hypothetical protein